MGARRDTGRVSSRVGRRLILQGALGATMAATIAAGSAFIVLGPDLEPPPMGRHTMVAVSRVPAGPVVIGGRRTTSLASAPSAPSAPSAAHRAARPVDRARIVQVPRMTRGGPQAEAAVIQPEAIQLERAELDRLERAVHAEDGARERIEVIDDLAQTTPPSRVIPLIERLLDRSVGRTADDVRALRIGLLSRLGQYRDDLRVERRLLDTAGDRRAPRLERLSAIDALRSGGFVRDSARTALERLASADPDLVIKRKVKWALGEG